MESSQRAMEAAQKKPLPGTMRSLLDTQHWEKNQTLPRPDRRKEKLTLGMCNTTDSMEGHLFSTDTSSLARSRWKLQLLNLQNEHHDIWNVWAQKQGSLLLSRDQEQEVSRGARAGNCTKASCEGVNYFGELEDE